MEEDRLWKFRMPQWLNSGWVRNAGVYGSGALVSAITTLASCASCIETTSLSLLESTLLLGWRRKVSFCFPVLELIAVTQFSIAFYFMLDAAVWSKSPLNGSNVHVKFVDWLPLVFSSLGMLIINSVEKQRLSSDSFSYSGSGVAWKARVVLFLGFAALAGGMAGGVTVFVLKYVVPSVAMPALGMGIENVVSNALVGVR